MHCGGKSLRKYIYEEKERHFGVVMLDASVTAKQRDAVRQQ